MNGGSVDGDGEMAPQMVDALPPDGTRVMREPWRDRRNRLEDLFDGRQLPRISIVPVTDDAARLDETWVGIGGEGIAQIRLRGQKGWNSPIQRNR